MEERYSFCNSVWESFRNGDFQEEDVWGVTKVSPQSHDVPVPVPVPVISVPRSMHSAARMIPSSEIDHHMTHEANVGHQQSSAPVSIPNWSKIDGKKSKRVSKNNASRVDVDSEEEEEDSDENDGDGDESEFEKMPPHELIARRLERTGISSFSVLEGVGRKLKGRDLSKVRNGVLIKTGFLESV